MEAKPVEPAADTRACQSGWRLSWPRRGGWPCTAPVHSRGGSRRRLDEGLSAARSSRPR